MSKPIRAANAISSNVVIKPPSDRSWYASTSSRFFCRNWKSFLSSSGFSRSGASVPIVEYVCPRMLPPKRCLPSARSTKSMTVSSGNGRSSGVTVSRISETGAKAETISDTGEVTVLKSSASCQRVCIDRESLPTGMVIPSAGHSSMPTASTASNNAASSPEAPIAAIQFADKQMSSILSTLAAAILVIASPMAMRAEAALDKIASGVLSPIAIASPVYPENPEAVTETSATGVCQGPTIWSRATSPPTERSPMVIKNFLLATVG